MTIESWGELGKYLNQLIKQGKLTRWNGTQLLAPNGDVIPTSGSTPPTEAQIKAAGPFLRYVANGDGSYSLQLTNDAILEFAQPVYKLSTQTITGISNLPDPTLSPPRSAVRLHADNFVGEGSNKKGIIMVADPVNACWVPDGNQTIFSGFFGNLAAGYKTITVNNSTVKFNIGTDCIVPGGLIVPGRSRLVIEYTYRKIGTTQPVMTAYLGTDLSTYTNNSIVYNQTTAATANLDVPAKSKIDFVSATAALCSNRMAEGGSGGGAAMIDASTLLNSAANMLVAFQGQLTTLTDEIRLYKFKISVEPT